MSTTTTDFPRTLQAIVESAPTLALAQCFCDELYKALPATWVWVGRQSGQEGLESVAIVGNGGFPARLSPAEGGLEAPLAQQLLKLGSNPRAAEIIPTGTAALAAWRPSLAADGAEYLWLATIGLPFRGRGLIVIGLRELLPDEHNLALYHSIRWLFHRHTLLFRQSAQARAMEQAGNSIFLCDDQGDIVWTNSSFEKLTGYKQQEVLGRNPRFLKSGQQSRRYYRDLWQSIQSGKVWCAETVDKDKWGFLYSINQSISPVQGEDGIDFYLSVHEDISQKKVLRQQQQHADPVDKLTGLLNPTGFHEQLTLAIEAAGSKGVAVASLVLANFESATCVLAQESADELEKNLINQIKQTLEPNDAACKMASGEYGLILRGAAGPPQIESRLEKLREAFSEPMLAAGESFYLQLRYGLAFYPADGQTSQALWLAADGRLVSAHPGAQQTREAG